MAKILTMVILLCLAVCLSPSTKLEAGGDGPPEQIQSLTKALAGTWTTDEKYEALFLTPKGGEGHGEQTFTAGPGGYTLLESYHTKTPAGELFGFGIIWWDKAKGLQHMWCINVYPSGCEMFPPQPQKGPQWDGKRLVVNVESEQDGKKTNWHEVIFDIKPDSFVQTADIDDGNGLKRWFTIRSIRKVKY